MRSSYRHRAEGALSTAGLEVVSGAERARGDRGRITAPPDLAAPVSSAFDQPRLRGEAGARSCSTFSTLAAVRPVFSVRKHVAILPASGRSGCALGRSPLAGWAGKQDTTACSETPRAIAILAVGMAGGCGLCCADTAKGAVNETAVSNVMSLDVRVILFRPYLGLLHRRLKVNGPRAGFRRRLCKNQRGPKTGAPFNLFQISPPEAPRLPLAQIGSISPSARNAWNRATNSANCPTSIASRSPCINC